MDLNFYHPISKNFLYQIVLSKLYFYIYSLLKNCPIFFISSNHPLLNLMEINFKIYNKKIYDFFIVYLIFYSFKKFFIYLKFVKIHFFSDELERELLIY